MVPRMASTFASGNKEKLREYMNYSFNFILLLAFPLIFGIISIANKFVPIFYGSGYEKVGYLISVISPIILIIGLSNVIGTQYLLPTKQQKEFTISVTIGAIVNFILNMIYIRLCKSVGASIATVIAEYTVTGVQFYLVRKEIKLLDVLKIAKNFFIASLVMFIVSLILGEVIKDNLISIIVQIGCDIILYFAILVALKDNMVLGWGKFIKNITIKSKC